MVMGLRNKRYRNLKDKDMQQDRDREGRMLLGLWNKRCRKRYRYVAR
jgi:hypothetical protein